MLNMWPYKIIFHIQLLATNFLPTPPIKLKLGLQVGGRLLIDYSPIKPSSQLETGSNQ
jgi:hypothetical protein